MTDLSDAHVRVTNGTDKTIVGRWAGIDYEFPAGKGVIVEKLVATHVFGFGVPDKTRTLLSLGWMQMSDQRESAMERLKLIRFEAVELVGKTIDDDDDAPNSQDVAPEHERTGSVVSPNDEASAAQGHPLRVPLVAPLRQPDDDDRSV